MDERRKYGRLNVAQNDIIATLKLERGQNDISVIGKLINISEGGMALEYIVMDSTAEELIQASCQVSLLRHSAPIGLSWPRSAIFIYDRPSLAQSFAVLTFRRCGLQWIEPLSKSQMESLVPV